MIHLAAIVGDPACQENPQLAAEINRAATRMLNRCCSRIRCPAVPLCFHVQRLRGLRIPDGRTCSGRTHFPVRPDESSSKIFCSESSLRIFTRRFFGWPPFSVSLPRPRFEPVVNLLTVRAVRSGRIKIFNGGQWRPLHARLRRCACLSRLS